MKLQKKETFKKLKARAWRMFSEYIRRLGAVDGKNSCVTCGVVKPWKELQAGHFIDGRHNAVLFNHLITYPQCVRCNIWLHGNKIQFTLFMQRKFGELEVAKLLSESRKIVKFDRYDLESIIKNLNDNLEELNRKDQTRELSSNRISSR